MLELRIPIQDFLDPLFFDRCASWKEFAWFLRQWIKNKLVKAGFDLSDKITWFDDYEKYERTYRQDA
jgi:hypothetical protein